MARRKLMGGPPPGFSTGLIQRNYKTHPSGYCAAAPSAPDDWLIPESEQPGRLEVQKANKASLFDLREANYSILQSLNQDGLGLCWAFSTTKSAMYLRTLMNEVKVVLSAWWVAGKVKGWRDQGGWNTESLELISSQGAPSEALCPSYNRQYDNAAVAADAGQRKITEWWDGSEDRQRNKQIMITAFLLGLAPTLDYNWLGHSMCGCFLESINPLVVFADNSWGSTDQYGPKGLYKLTGDHAIPDNISVPRAMTAPGA